MSVHYHPAGDVTPEILAEDPLRIELYGRRYIRKSRRWRFFVDENQTHDSRPVSTADAAYLEQRFPFRRR